MTKKFFFIFAISTLSSINAFAECPQKITHDEARLIAKGDSNSHLIAQYEPVDMKDIVKKGTSSAYTDPVLKVQREDIGNRWLCEYEYKGKVTNRAWDLKFSIPKHPTEK